MTTSSTAPVMTAPTRTLDQVESDLTRVQTAKARLAAAELRLLREADRMQAHAVDGARTMTEWVAARCDVAPETAETLMRTARILADAPDLEALLSDGVVSVDRNVELARAHALDIDVADHRAWDIAGLRTLIARRTPRRRDRRPVDPFLVLQPSLDRTHWRLWGRLEAADGDAVDRALDRRADEITRGLPERPLRTRARADALVSVCTERSGDPEIVVFVDRHGATANGHLPVDPDVVDEAACIGSFVTVDISDPGRPLIRGSRTRATPRALRQTVLHRDGGVCAMAGCQSRYRVEPHHIVHREHHGPNDPENLVSLCWFHHHVAIHRRGHRLDPASPPQARRFLRTGDRAPPPR